MNYLKNYFADWNLYEKLWLLISTVTILALSYYWKDSAIGVIASITGIWCVVLVAKGRISNYFFGVVNVLAYAYVAYSWQYYGEVMLNVLYYFPMNFVGLYVWTRAKNRKKNNKDAVNVKFLSNKGRIFWSIVSAFAIVVYGLILKEMGGSLPFVDSTSTVLSVVAMILMVQLYMEQWVLWIVVNIVSIIMWAVVMAQGGNDIAVLLMWTAFLINAFYGLYNWIKLYKEQKNG